MLVNSYFDNMDEAWTTVAVAWIGWVGVTIHYHRGRGFATSFHVGVGGGPFAMVEPWWMVISGATGATLTLPAVTLADDGAVFTATKLDEPGWTIEPATLAVVSSAEPFPLCP